MSASSSGRSRSRSRSTPDLVSLRGVIEIRMDGDEGKDFAQPIDLMDLQEEIHVSHGRAAGGSSSRFVFG